MRAPTFRHAGARTLAIAATLWSCALVIYGTTFLCTPRLFLFPESASSIGDVPEYAAALRGRPNLTDMRKHPLYTPLGRALYRAVNLLRIRAGINQDAVAVVFPGALYGATAVALSYALFRRFTRSAVAAAVAAARGHESVARTLSRAGTEWGWVWEYLVIAVWALEACLIAAAGRAGGGP